MSIHSSTPSSALLRFRPREPIASSSRGGAQLSLATHQVGVAADVLSALSWRITAFRSASGPQDIRDMLNAVLNTATSLVACDAAGVYVFDSRRLRVKYRVVRGYPGALTKQAIPQKDDGPVGRSLVTGQFSRVRVQSQDIPERPSARARIVVPIIGSRGFVLGAIDLISDHAGSFDDFAADLLTVFSAAVASSIDSARLYRQMARKAEIDRDLHVARELVEETALSRAPAVPGFDIHVTQRSSLPVGGDYCEFLPLEDGRWGIVIADVSGKGVSAALLVSAIRALIRSSIEARASLRDTVQRINRFFRSCGNGHFVTLFYGILDTNANELTYINAGHHPPILLRSNGVIERLDCAGLPLGFFDPSRHQEARVVLGSSDVLSLYTDGVVESTNERDEQFGDERLVNALSRSAAADSRALVDSVIMGLCAFAGPRLHDDRTLVVMQSRRT